MFRNKFIRDTVLLTIMQLFLDSAALVLNVFITRRLGASGTGILALTGSFLGLAGIIAGGNSFLCTSRLISEELGRGGDPDGVLRHGIKLCLIMSTAVSAVLFILAEPFSVRFFHGKAMARAIRLMPFALISGAVTGCFKGWLNACRRSSAAAVGDVLEFLIRSAVIVVMTLAGDTSDEGRISAVMIAGIIAGNIFALIYASAAYFRFRKRGNSKVKMTFRRYAALSFPIMGGGILTASLSSTNDALIPICLRQYGDSVKDALSSFGLFEAIVIPTLFFPSVVLCSIAGMVVSETARAAGAGDCARIKRLAERLTEATMAYAVFAASVLMRFGRPIGELLGGGETAGNLITAISPVVPFIYMEIILEAMIKGMGQQAFSSLNYLAEYAVRIAIVLIFVSRMGFAGIAASYYASNIIGNCCRFVKLKFCTGMKADIFRLVIMPVMYSFLTMGTTELILRKTGICGESAVNMLIFSVVWGIGYFAIYRILSKVRGIDRKAFKSFVQDI